MLCQLAQVFGCGSRRKSYGSGDIARTLLWHVNIVAFAWYGKQLQDIPAAGVTDKLKKGIDVLVYFGRSAGINIFLRRLIWC